MPNRETREVCRVRSNDATSTEKVREWLTIAATSTGIFAGLITFVGLLAHASYVRYMTDAARGGIPFAVDLELLLQKGMAVLPETLITVTVAVSAWLLCSQPLARVGMRIAGCPILHRLRINARALETTTSGVALLMVLVAGLVSTGTVATRLLAVLGANLLLLIGQGMTHRLGDPPTPGTTASGQTFPAANLRWSSVLRGTMLVLLVYLLVTLRIEALCKDTLVYEVEVQVLAARPPSRGTAQHGAAIIQDRVTLKGFLVASTKDLLEIKDPDSNEAYIVRLEDVESFKVTGIAQMRSVLKGGSTATANEILRSMERLRRQLEESEKEVAKLKREMRERDKRMAAALEEMQRIVKRAREREKDMEELITYAMELKSRLEKTLGTPGSTSDPAKATPPWAPKIPAEFSLERLTELLEGQAEDASRNK